MDFTIPTIIIGLGGTGLKVIYRLKTSIPSEILEKGLLKFLVIDSDKNDPMISELQADEYINIGVPGVASIISNLDSEAAKFIRPWFPSNLPFKVVSGDEGAKQFRAMGRLYLFKNIDKIYNTIDRTVKSLRAKFADISNVSKTLNVFLISSTCGGTGSGILLDTAYLVRHIIEVENANPCLIKGILVLPTAFHPFPISDESERKNIFANGFATIKEIDYYMNPNLETTYNVKYTENKEISSNKSPFDVCYLIDDENEEFPIGGLDDTLDAIAESLSVLLTAGVGTSIKSAEDNLYTILTTNQKSQPYSHKNYLYSSFGTSSIIYPYEKIKRYILGKLVSYFDKELSKELDYTKVIYDIFTSLKIEELTRDDIINSIYNKTKPNVYSDIYEKITQISNDEVSIKIKEITKVDYNEISEEKVNQKVEELVKTKYDEFINLMEEYIKNPLYGLKRVYDLFSNENMNIFKYIDKTKESLKNEIDQHKVALNKINEDLKIYIENLEKDSKKFLNKLLNKKNKDLVEKIAKTVDNLNNHYLSIILKEGAINFYQKLALMLSKYRNERIDKLYDAWNNFKRNYINSYLNIKFESKLSSWGNRINFYLADKEKIENIVDNILNNNKIYEEIFRVFDNFSKFEYSNLNNYNLKLLKWIEENYKDYLDIDLEDLAISLFKDEDNVVNNLERASSILFRYKSQLFDNSLVKNYKVLGVKNIDSTRFFNVAKIRGIEVVEGYNSYRISMLQVKHGLPIYSFVLIDNMKKAYEEVITTSLSPHIDPFYHKVEDPTLEEELSDKDLQMYYKIYMAFIFDLITKKDLNYIINLEGIDYVLGKDKIESIEYIRKNWNNPEFNIKFNKLLDKALSSYTNDSLSIILKDNIDKKSKRAYYLNNKKILTNEEVKELKDIEREIEVLQKYLDSIQIKK
ncbi:MAG: tubulin-like doman-containing protein [bacterium]|jgi:hypothetical protein